MNRSTTIPVRLGERSYRILVTEDRFQGLGPALAGLRLGPEYLVVTNRIVRRTWGAAVAASLRRQGGRVRFVEIPDTERAKSFRWAGRLLRQIARHYTTRIPCLVALGGGVVGDLTGFVASCYRRGIPYVQVPTTLLAQVDSAIGGKTAVDVPQAKNLVGALYQPRLVYATVACLRSLPLRQRRSGLSEVVKYGAIQDARLLAYVERRAAALLRGEPSTLRQVVERCARIKAGLVSQDERERRGQRTLLNFGHTIGHAIEAASHYSGRYTHGEAIAIGMVGSAELGAALGITPPGLAPRLERLFRRLGLPTTARRLSARRVLAALRYDKKFSRGKVRWVVLRGAGRAQVVDGIPEDLVRGVTARRLGAHR